MVVLLTIVHILVCFFLVVVVLLQSGKAADLAGAFGGMGSQTTFGPRGSATVLSKATTIAAAVFMLSSLTLAILAQRNVSSTGSVLEKQKAPAKSAPAKAGQPAAPQQAVPQPAAPQPGQLGQPGATPSVTITPPGGGTTTVPLTVPPTTAPAQPPAQSAPKK